MDFSTPRPTFDAAPIAFGRHAQHTAEPGPHTSRAITRRLKMLHEAGHFAEVLREPPQADTSIHLVLTGRFDPALLVPRILDWHQAPCEWLRLATLSFNRDNCATLLGLLEARRIERLTLLCSKFFQSHYADLCEWFSSQLAEFPGSRLAVARSHCKVWTFAFHDGRVIVVETSANARSNSNREQLTIFADPALAAWHNDWIDQLVNDDAEETQREQGRDGAAD